LATEIIVNATGCETRVALVEGGRLAELHIDRGDDRGFVGNVYLGRVVRVLPGMQAAFVDVGLERAAFLYVGDIDQEFLHLHDGDPADDGDGAPEDAPPPRTSARSGHPPIQDLLKEGQEIVVQVSKDPIGTKGARLTTHVALPGRYLVYMPTVEHVGISRRIERDKERRRLREFVEHHRPPGAGFIVRTVCEGRSTDTLKADMDWLTKTWEKVQTGSRTAKAPALLHSERGLVLRAVRDLFDDHVERLVIDDRDLHAQVKQFMGELMPDLKDRLHLYRGVEPIFDTFGVEASLQRSLGRKVWLKSGGYLVIDQTEALMAIDVNSGKFVGSSSLEETTLRINLEAVEEVVDQLRLRNMGGIIIIDFIDMEKESSRDRVYRALDDALKRDRARTNVLRISDLGLVEMTRKRVQEGLDRYLNEECTVCRGSGVVRSRSTVCFEILRAVRREVARAGAGGVEQALVQCAPGVAEQMYGEHAADLLAVEESLRCRLVIRPMGHYHPEQFDVAVLGGASDDARR
jgi:ribonuclease G